MKTINSILMVALAITMFSCGDCCKKDGSSANVKKNIGLQMYSLRDEIGENSKNIDSVIVKTGRMGYKYVESASYWDGKIYGLTPQDFKAKLDAAGLTALSCHISKPLADDVTQTNWDEVWGWWDKSIADHKAAGMKYIVTPSMPTPPTVEALQAYCDYYNKIGEKCVAAGLKFGYHNHSFEFEKKYDDGTIMYDYLVQHTDASKVFFELDVYWAVMGRRAPVDLFKKYPGRFDVLHIKDKEELGESGMVGFDAIFNNIDKAGAKYLIVEVERYTIPRFESVQASLDYLNKSDFVKEDYSK
jgi:sugar phosphate isomerase/epimerase